MSIVIEIYMLMLKSATDVGILRLTAGCEWNSLQRFVDGGLVLCRGGAPVPARASCER